MIFINYFKNNILFSSAVVFIFFFIFYGSIYFFVDGISTIDDHFFHIKFAQLLETKGIGIADNFNWFSTSEEKFGISLFQIALIPFTYFKDLIIGLKISDVFWAALTLAVIYFSLKKFGIKNSFLVLLIILSSTFLSIRLFAGRAYVLTFGLILLEIYFSQRKKYLKFFWISFFHILWHQASLFFPPLVFLSVEASRYLVDKKIEIKGAIASFFAVVLGMSFYPNFPKNIFNWIYSVFNLKKEFSSGLKLEGDELYTGDALEMFINNPIFSFLGVVSIVLVIYLYIKNKKEKINPDSDNKNELILIFTFFILILVFNLGSIKISGRFFDYYLLVSVILFVIILKFLLRNGEITPSKEIQKYIVVSCFIFFSFFCLDNYLNIRINVFNSNYETIKSPIEWIRDNSNEKEMVYLFNWSDFTRAFFYNDKNIYSWGMEPKNLYNKDPKLYWKAYNIMAYGFYCEKQKDCEEDAKLVKKKYEEMESEDQKDFRKENSRKIINSIKNDFGSRFVLSTNSSFSELIEMNEDLIEDKFKSVSKNNEGYEITAFKLK